MEPRRPDRIRWAAAGSLAVAVAAFGVAAYDRGLGLSGLPEAPGVATGTGSADAGWYPEYQRDLQWILDPRVASRPLDIDRLDDATTEHIRIDRHHRVSWAAPPCGCARLSVWLYGGSAAFGLEQRDGHTIASEIARAAAAQGVVVDVSNRGVPDQTLWNAAIRFAWDVAGEPPPDLVIFYGGAEELDAASTLLALDRGDVLAPFERSVEMLQDEVVGNSTAIAPTDVVIGGWPTTGETPAEDAADLAARRFRRGQAFAIDTAAAGDIPITFVWQPSNGYLGTPSSDSDLRTAGERLGPAVLDLSGLLDDRGLAGGLHPGEDGARRIADAIVRRTALAYLIDGAR